MRRTSTAGSGVFTPDAITVGARHLEVGGEQVASFAVTGYPREVHPGWLQPLLTYPGRLDVSLHIEPVDPVTAADRLKKQVARLGSGTGLDPHAAVALRDAEDLADRLARSQDKLFRFGLYLTVHAHTAQELATEVAAVRSLAASLLLDAKPASYRSLQAWITTLPLGLDQLGLRRTFDTTALAASFPFPSPDLPAPDPASAAAPTGVLYGFNLGSQGLVHHDRFACANHNSVILGSSGAGKSYLVKLEALRSLYRGVQVLIVDPEDEYARLAAAIGGTHLQLGATEIHLNPLDLPVHTRPDGRRTAPRDALVRRCLFLHTVVAVLLGAELDATQRLALDRAITATYAAAGITADPRTWLRPAPLLADLATALTQVRDPAAVTLAARLQPYTTGAFSGLFAKPTTLRQDGHFVVFSLRELAEELKPLGTLLALDAVWRQVSNAAIRRPRLVVVDEAWMLMRQPAGAEFLFRMAKAGRKHWAGLTVATQDAADVLGSDIGKAVIANASTQILLRQAPQAIEEIGHAFTLSAGERQFLLSAAQGQGLLATGPHRVAFQALASPAEHALITTSPAELAALTETTPETTPEAFVDLESLAPGAVSELAEEVDLDAA
ncbi:VirB4 family type IV secretion system protein [Crossiella sp. CA198]|uniref:VirB4 family type IV secretion system protein n=1 Tax=Crossiella sp. CA198 TaxID=3455607 RepID=UPI003F8D0A6E